MPDELAEWRDRYLTAMQNTVAAENARDAAEAEAQAAADLAASAQEAWVELQDIETSARAAYVAALRSHGYVDTASGPVPAEAGTGGNHPAACGNESPNHPGIRCSLVAGHIDTHYGMGTGWRR